MSGCRFSRFGRASALSLIIAAGWNVAASAQETAVASDTLPTVVVDGEATATPAYRFGDGLNSGTTVLSEEAVRTRAPGSGDAIQLLKLIPGAQFALDEAEATRDSLRDLRPAEVSISGARATENMFVLDGVGVNTLFEINGPGSTGTSPAHFNDVAGVSAQSIWIDTNLIGGITVRDSNISAEYGRFTGGVVEIVTREPAREASLQGSIGYTGTDMTSYKLAPVSAEDYPDGAPETPNYVRRRWGLSGDLPVGESFRLLAGVNHSEASTIYNRSTNYGGGTYGSKSVSDNYLLKLAADLPGEMKLSAQVTHAPYRSEYEGGNARNNMIMTHGGGTTASLDMTGAWGPGEWKLSLSQAFSDNDREAPDNNFSRPRLAGGSVDWCSASSCTEGGFGDIHQRQYDTTLNGTWSQPFLGTDLRLGFTYTRVRAQKERLQENRAYRTGSTTVGGVAVGQISPLTQCASATDVSCVTGEYALAEYVAYRPYDVDIDIDAVSLWGESVAEIAGFTLRAGLRYDHESYLGNHNLSPRLSVSHKLPWGVTATAGLNRYYGRSFLGYAVREAMPPTVIYSRRYTLSGGRRLWSDNWFLSSYTQPTAYSTADLSTPYNDEATLALTGPLLGGEWRVKGVYREGRDLISSDVAETLVYDSLGTPRTYRSYSVTNGGESRYTGGTLEWLRTFGNHSLTASTSFSKTKSSAVDYYDISDDETLEFTRVVYNGRIVSLLDLAKENQRIDFAAPFTANLDWQSRWFDERLTMTVSGRYRGGFKRIEDTGVNERIDAVSYDVYDVVSYDPSVDVDLNASLDLVRRDGHSATLDLRVSNLFDTVPNRNVGYSSQPWQLGRVVWVGFNFRF